MGKHWKHAIIVICFMVLMLSACGGQMTTVQESEASTLSAEDQQIFFSNWEEVLRFHEETNTHMDWAFRYVEVFLTDNTWDSLQKARAACAAARIACQRVAIPEFTITDEQYSRLANAGIDVDSVFVEMTNLEAEWTDKLYALTNLEGKLQRSVFLTADVTVLESWIDIYRSIILDLSQCLCLQTNYLLLQLDDSEQWERIITAYPVIAEGHAQWCDQPSLLEEKTSLALDSYETHLMRMEEYLGTGEYTLLLVQEALETGNLDYLRDEIHIISDVPGYLVTPTWLPDHPDYYYQHILPGTEEQSLVVAGDELNQPLSSCLISCPGITLEDVTSYEERLKEWGVEHTGSWDEADQEYELFIMFGSCRVLIVWTEEHTSLYFSDPIACLIPELYFLAMLEP